MAFKYENTDLKRKFEKKTTRMKYEQEVLDEFNYREYLIFNCPAPPIT